MLVKGGNDIESYLWDEINDALNLEYFEYQNMKKTHQKQEAIKCMFVHTYHMHQDKIGVVIAMITANMRWQC